MTSFAHARNDLAFVLGYMNKGMANSKNSWTSICNLINIYRLAMPILVGQNTGPAGPALAAMFGPPFDKSSPAQYVVRINLRSGGEATVALHSL